MLKRATAVLGIGALPAPLNCATSWRIIHAAAGPRRGGSHTRTRARARAHAAARAAARARGLTLAIGTQPATVADLGLKWRRVSGTTYFTTVLSVVHRKSCCCTGV